MLDAIELRARNAAYQRTFRQRHGSSRGNLPFIGVDGEGAGTDELGRQNYLLLRAGEDELFDNNQRLDTASCLEFLLSLPRNAILVGFFFTYDATMILRDVPVERLPLLFEDEATRIKAGRRSAYVFWQDYAIEFRPRQYFRVARLDRSTLRVVPNSSRTVNEVGGFFQKSFVEVLRDRGVGDQKTVDMIARNKERRGDFVRIGKRERDYCAAECRLLAEIMEGFRDDCVANGIAPRAWRGAGALAARLHELNHTEKRQDRMRSAALDRIAIEAYYGGRFEITTIGRVPGPIYEYDINSAYPAAMLKLPCPAHTRWRKFNGDPPADSIHVAELHFKHPRSAKLCGLPVRDKGKLFWPAEASGVYWSPEIGAAINVEPTIELTYGKGYHAEIRCDCRPFDWVRELYELRKRIGKATAGYPIKLGINALYGKLAQRQGAAPYRDHVGAGLITAYTRAQLINAYASDPGAILMLATDALFSRHRLPLDIGGSLGQWEEKERAEGLFIVQPGIYWTPGSDQAMPKTRGVPRSQIIAERGRFEEAWQRWCAGDGGDAAPTIPLYIDNFIGHRLALSRGKPSLAGMWIKSRKNISFDWRNKRLPTGAARNGMVATRPYPGHRLLVSQPYDPELLTELSEQLLEDEALPDYTPWGNTVE